MNYEEFICRVQAEVKEKMGEKAQVERRRITKNNGVELEGITITEEGQRISPMIYLDEYYSIYERGVTIPQIGEDILRIYERSRESLPKTPDFYTDFEKVKARLACKLINYQRNEKQLARVPYVRCLDLALVFYYALEEEEIGRGTILIYNSHLTMWGISKEQLYEAARRNTPGLLPYEFIEMRELLAESFADGEDFEEELPMYVLSNRERHFGAVNMIYDSVLSEIGRRIGDDFYVLPSSVHECIIVPAGAKATRSELSNMVWDINRTQVLPEEVLSDNVYFYERKNHRLSM